MKNIMEPTPEVLNLLKACGSSDKAVAFEAQYQLAKAIETPLREGIQAGDVLAGIYRSKLDGNTEIPLDLLAPGTEGQFTAYTNPGHGYIPQKSVESDYVRITTYGLASAIDILLKYARNGDWDVAGRAVRVMENGFVKKMNDDGWHTLLAAAADRNILVYDADAASGQITKRLFSLMKSVMRRNGGGNSVTSRGRLTDLFLSIEGVEDIRNWGIDQLDDVSRREIYVAADGGAPLTRIYGVTLHDLFELGDGQEYQDYFISDLAASLSGTDTELVVGLDLSSNDSFVMPITRPLEVFSDEALHRHQRMGWYATMEAGFGVLDGRRTLVGSF